MVSMLRKASNGKDFMKEIVGIWAKDYDHLEEILEKLDETKKIKNFQDYEGVPFIRISLVCGCKIQYPTMFNVPRRTRTCSHGNYFIRVESDIRKKV